mmetsp:Transcript_5906/g.12916  ORF Transcript_5906/g.12916 Transcript_5906/m.12916 type:complete len:119 (+) Transcript_5906:65-421(+)
MMFSQSTSSTAILDNCNMVSPMRSNRQNPCEKESRHHPTSFCKVLGASFLIILYNTKFITPTVAGNGNSPGEVKKMEAMKNAWSDDSSTHPVLRLDYSNFESTVFHSGMVITIAAYLC